jgi:hypothetical protein
MGFIMYNYYYPYTVGQNVSQMAQQFAKKNIGWLVAGILGTGILSYFFFRLAHRTSRDSENIVIAFKPPKASEIKINEKELELAIAEEGKIVGARPITEAVSKALYKGGIKSLKKDDTFRNLWTQKGFVENRPFYDARRSDNLNPTDPRWEKAVWWWALNWYNLSPKERKKIWTEGKPEQSNVAKEKPERTHESFSEAGPSQRGLSSPRESYLQKTVER